MLSMAMWMLMIVAPIQAVVGDMHGLNTLEHQPAKIAAIEGHWRTKGGNPCRCCCSAYPTWQRKPPATPSASRAWAAWS
jgi:cytochrome d ubiquinol oxidase subunit I